jgi:dolichol-phosphate mannosyltransferase
MLEALEKVRSGDDLVIASRFAGVGRMIGCPWTRYLYSIGLSWVMRFFIRLPRIKDYSMFYRAYRISLLKKGFERYGDRLVTGKGFSVMGGCLIKLCNLSDRFSEIPLILRYDKKRGTSGMNVWKTVSGYLELISEAARTDRFRKR